VLQKKTTHKKLTQQMVVHWILWLEKTHLNAALQKVKDERIPLPEEQQQLLLLAAAAAADEEEAPAVAAKTNEPGTIQAAALAAAASVKELHSTSDFHPYLLPLLRIIHTFLLRVQYTFFEYLKKYLICLDTFKYNYYV